ncbi:MAG: LacI family transcriptional regulator, partial [Bacteroidaceae bacterium]|nr:LacI family transcriptional regulator [Bacteroidaceae bacterium]
ICGFTDGIRAKSCDPQLTTVEQRGYDVGVAAATCLIEEYEAEGEEKQKFRNRIIKTKLIVRGTTKPLTE